ncbi:CLUMA_CG008745, isoform A [Clunio marinus]|uniref:CLUMA_CG008745, isoform A n=1 Tax=Clunio marinus TaxID=568069 RepID=A0A1J1I4S3_9DIPT|nr:CLUMA_CG008745, isoform A [Clunio marinus]
MLMEREKNLQYGWNEKLSCPNMITAATATRLRRLGELFQKVKKTPRYFINMVYQPCCAFPFFYQKFDTAGNQTQCRLNED